MKSLKLLAIGLMLCALPAMAQNSTSGFSKEDSKALESANWYVPLNYGGFEFEIPAGSVVEKNSKVVVKYPDGSFGMSMENETLPGNQKIAFEQAKMYADRYKLADSKVEKVTIGGIKGATATGTLENFTVKVIILPVTDQQLTTVLMATPNRQEWVDHFIQSMHR